VNTFIIAKEKLEIRINTMRVAYLFLASKRAVKFEIYRINVSFIYY